MQPADPASSRSVAVKALGDWLSGGVFLSESLPADSTDHAFVLELCHGVARRRRTLEWAIERCSDRRPTARLLPVLLAGAYQVFYMDGVPDYAAVHETVQAVPAGLHPSAAGYVNAVLRRLVRERTRLLADLAAQPLAVRESHPDLLVERWTRRLGEARTAALCAWNNRSPPVCLHPRPGAQNAGEARACLEAAGIGAVPHEADPDRFLVLERGNRPAALPGFDKGAFTIQDPATAAAVDLLEVRPGMRVLDACAAPGGKTALLAEALAGTGSLVAADADPARLDRLRDTLRRLRLETVTVALVGEPEHWGAVLAGPFDRILLDVPCSNTGVLRRRPEARWRFSEIRLKRLAERQARLLDAAAGLLAPGGRLVYSTCSMEPEENERLVTAWLTRHPAWRLAGSRAILPGDRDLDGAFAAALVC